MHILSLMLFAIIGYLLGSIPTGVVLARLFGWPDPREHGSGNTGGMNAYRGGGVVALLLVALGDMAKGIAAVLLAQSLSTDPWAIPVAGIAAVAGHNWPVWLGFKGGMGLATSAAATGTQVILAPLITAAVWLILRPIIKHSPRSTVLAALTVPITLYLLRVDLPVFLLGTGTTLLAATRTLMDWNRAYERETPAPAPESD